VTLLDRLTAAQYFPCRCSDMVALLDMCRRTQKYLDVEKMVLKVIYLTQKGE